MLQTDPVADFGRTMAELLLRSKLTRYSFKQVVGILPTLLLLLGDARAEEYALSASEEAS